MKLNQFVYDTFKYPHDLQCFEDKQLLDHFTFDIVKSNVATTMFVTASANTMLLNPSIPAALFSECLKTNGLVFFFWGGYDVEDDT